MSGLSDADFIKWLRKSSKRFHTILVEAGVKSGGIETTRYFASIGYTANPTDAAANRKYVPAITGGAVTRASLALNGGGSFAISDIILSNVNGELDAYVYDIWMGRPVRMYVGDMRWPTTDFRLVFDGIADGIKPGERDQMVLSFRDKLQRLNTAVSEHKLGGTSSNKDRLIPWALGELHNVTGLLIDEATLKIQWNDGAMERVIETRDNGVIIATTNTLASGFSTLTRRPFGAVTASIQGAKFGGVYVNTVSTIVQALAQNFGQDPFVGADLDAANLAAFDAAWPQPVGRFLSETENIYSVMQEFANSVNAQALTNEIGKLQLLKVALPATGTATRVTEANMVYGTLKIADVPEVIAASSINYCKNWTVQETLDTGVPFAHKILYALEWLSTGASDNTIATDNKITKAPEPRNTLLLRKTDADTIAAEDMALWGPQRVVLSYDGEAELMLEPLGGPQIITAQRFGCNAGKDAQIVYVERDWINMTVKFQVLI